MRLDQHWTLRLRHVLQQVRGRWKLLEHERRLWLEGPQKQREGPGRAPQQGQGQRLKLVQHLQS